MTLRAAARRHGLGWHLINGVVNAWSAVLAEHRRSRRCAVLLVDETSMRKRHRYVSVIVNGDTGQTLAMVEHRNAAALSAFLMQQGHRWCKGVKVVVSVGIEDVSRFVARLRARADNVIVFDDTAAVRSAATVNRHLGALFGFYDRRPRRRRPPRLRPDPPTRHRSATAPPRHRATDHVRTRRPHSRRVPVLALPPARPASRHRPTPPSCHSPGCPRSIT